MPLAAEAQQAGRTARVGILAPFSPGHELDPFQPFIEELQRLGWVEGKNLILHRRYAERRNDRLPRVSGGAGTTPRRCHRHIDNACSSYPQAGDFGYPDSGRCDRGPGCDETRTLSRPGGNLTGLSSLASELNAKRLQLLPRGSELSQPPQHKDCQARSNMQPCRGFGHWKEIVTCAKPLSDAVVGWTDIYSGDSATVKVQARTTHWLDRATKREGRRYSESAAAAGRKCPGAIEAKRPLGRGEKGANRKCDPVDDCFTVHIATQIYGHKESVWSRATKLAEKNAAGVLYIAIQAKRRDRSQMRRAEIGRANSYKAFCNCERICKHESRGCERNKEKDNQIDPHAGSPGLPGLKCRENKPRGFHVRPSSSGCWSKLYATLIGLPGCDHHDAVDPHHDPTAPPRPTHERIILDKGVIDAVTYASIGEPSAIAPKMVVVVLTTDPG